MRTTARDGKAPVRWRIYHQDREYAREAGDPCLGVVEATTKPNAEAEARRRGISGPTGLWAHPLERGLA
jgi:hypothetical protein